MAKHSKGKHVASRAKHSVFSKHENNLDNESERDTEGEHSRAADDAETLEVKSDLSSASPAVASDAAHVADAPDAVEVTGKAAAADTSDTFEKADNADGEGRPDATTADIAKTTVTAEGEHTSSSEAEALPEKTDKDTSNEDAPASAGEASDTTPVIPFEIKGSNKKRFNAKRVGIACAIVVGLLGAVYLGGAAFFSSHVFPNTSLSSLDISFDDAPTAQAELEDKVGTYRFTIKGQGVNMSMTSDEAGLSLESDAVVDAILSSQNIWKWPIEVFRHHDETDVVTEAMSANGLADTLAPVVAKANETATAPQSAKVVFNPNKATFEIIPEVLGSTLDLEKVAAQVAEGAINLQKNVVLSNESLVKPEVFRDDARLAQAQKTANDLITTNVALNIGGNPVVKVDASTIGPWVAISPVGEVTFNNEALTSWAQGVADSCNTVGSERTYTRPDGKVVTVKGGNYGWKINSNELVTQITDAVNSKMVGAIDIPVIQSGNGFAALGSQDWGARYVDVDISEQWARFYDNAGNLVWETPIITGSPGRSTPTGVFSVNRKQSPTVLIGQMTSEGVPEYESHVTYWMPFVGNSVGLHDATWQSSFGGNRYRQGFGSHGCVNLPFSAARDLYSMIEIGDVVVVHY